LLAIGFMHSREGAAKPAAEIIEDEIDVSADLRRRSVEYDEVPAL